jgi:hypothetical protein
MLKYIRTRDKLLGSLIGVRDHRLRIDNYYENKFANN